MNVIATIQKLRMVTQKNGATEAEEKTAAEKIGKLLMAAPELAVGLAQAKPQAAPFTQSYSPGQQGYQQGTPTPEQATMWANEILRQAHKQAQATMNAEWREQMRRAQERVRNERVETYRRYQEEQKQKHEADAQERVRAAKQAEEAQKEPESAASFWSIFGL